MPQFIIKNHTYSPLSVLATLLLWLIGHAGYGQVTLTPPKNPAVICWQEGVKLRWRDFQAPRNPKAGTSFDVGACCGSQIAVLGYENAVGKNDFVVESFFEKKNSWVRDSASIFNQTLLAHEQLHFDVNELFARKIRLKIAQGRAAGIEVWGPEMGKEINCLLEEQGEFNAAFDEEAHADPGPQPVRKWQIIVLRELATLGAYKSTAATCGQ